MYHVVSRHPALRMKNDSRSARFTTSTLICQACIVRPSCSSTHNFNQSDLVLTPDTDFCETHPLPLIASIQLTPSLDQVFKHFPLASSQFHVYSVAEVCQSISNSVRMELAEIPDVKRMSLEALEQLFKPIAANYSSISLATSAALSAYLPTCTAVCFSLLSITVSLLTFCVTFTLLLRQWSRLFSHPQQFFKGTSGRFLHIVKNFSPTTAVDSSFLYLSVAEFEALQELAQETLRQPTFNANPTTYSTTKPPHHPVLASNTTSTNHNRVYPIVTAPIYQETSSQIFTHNRSTSFQHFMSYLYVYMYTSECIHMSTYPYSLSRMMFFDAYRRLFSPIPAYPASWHVSVPLVLLFFY